MSVRVRFAPSPTGFLHVGGLRTALYNYLFAKHFGGKCILRIEDTDRNRFVENAADNLITVLRWAGIEFDESPEKGGAFGPYIQSERLELYNKLAALLISNNKAYYAFDTAEEIDEMRAKQAKDGGDTKYLRNIGRNSFTLGVSATDELIQSGAQYVIRLNVPENEEISFKDIIRGDVTVRTSDIDDQVLLKSDGFPTYHLANVVDDYEMGITHVIRGEEWLPSTPKHVLLYRAFGWEMPQFAHLPLLLNKDKTKLSKRQGSVAVEDFISAGYFREALINFVGLLGFNPSADKEIYSMEELIEGFSLEKVNKGGAVFDLQKLDWFQGYYLRTYSNTELAELLEVTLKSLGMNSRTQEYLEKIIILFKERVTFIKEIPEKASYMFAKPAEFEQDYFAKHWKENTIELILPLVNIYKETNEFTHTALHDLTKNFVENAGLKLKELIHPLRLMITGRSTGAGMFETMEVLGRQECLARIEYFIKMKEKENL
ncbi:MAG: Glutamyl/glutaminyl-tRNA synthetase [Ignavibacteria bacterium]|nr:Glutamyl/glutaminyl-tRNA synthetase [Ignavibacteria bacterium]